MAATRAYIDRHWMHDDAPLMYAFNTGVGLFKDQRMLVADMAEYQRKTVWRTRPVSASPSPRTPRAR